jgi:hypothetical protein
MTDRLGSSAGRRTARPPSAVGRGPYPSGRTRGLERLKSLPIDALRPLIPLCRNPPSGAGQRGRKGLPRRRRQRITRSEGSHRGPPRWTAPAPGRRDALYKPYGSRVVALPAGACAGRSRPRRHVTRGDCRVQPVVPTGCRPTGGRPTCCSAEAAWALTGTAGTSNLDVSECDSPLTPCNRQEESPCVGCLPW